MIDASHKGLSIERQCALVSISKSSYYYEQKGESELNLRLMELMDIQFMETPFYGSRQMVRFLGRQGYCVSRKRIRRLMKKMCISAIYQKPNTSKPEPGHKIYPYLLRNLPITRPNQVWCTDITYIAMPRGSMYLIAIMDWYSRDVLSWRLSNTMDTGFCIEALEEALEKYGAPEIFNTDQGSQFTSFEWINVLKEHGVKISMDGKGRWMDNVFIERLWRSVKYECVFLHAYETGGELRKALGKWFDFYNFERPHSTFDGQTPNEVYNQIAA
jgi:putative transposase